MLLRKKRVDGFGEFITNANTAFVRYARNDAAGRRVAASLIEENDIASFHETASPIISKPAVSQRVTVLIDIRAAEAGTERWLRFDINAGANGVYILVDPTNGVISSPTATGTGWTYVSSSSQSLGNNFHQIRLTVDTGLELTYHYSFSLYSTEFESHIYDGDGISGIRLAHPGPIIIGSTGTAPVNTSRPVITGTNIIGDTISASTGGWTGSPAPTFTYQWRRNGVNVTDATDQTWVIAGSTGQVASVVVTATNASGSVGMSSLSHGPFQSSGPVAPANTALPQITGSPVEGQVLNCSQGTWTGTAPITYAYQWKRGATNVGTNSPSYTLVSGDVSSTMSCVVTADNAAAGTTSATSNSTATVTAATLPLSAPEIAAGVFISPSGNDTTGAGTIAAPYLTLNKAKLAVRADGAKTTIYPRGGNYPFTTPEVFRSADGDRDGLSIIRYPGEVPVFNAGAAVSWVDAGSGVWTATLTAPQAAGMEGLIVNDVNYDASRFPLAGPMGSGTGWFHMDAGTSGSSQWFIYKASQISGAIQTQLAAAFAAGRLQCYRYSQHGWAASLAAVSGFNTTTRRVDFVLALNDTHGPGARFYFRKVANSAAELAEGHWCVIGTTLSFRPVAGSGFDGSNTFIRYQPSLLDFRGVDVANYMEDVTIRGIEFRNTRWVPGDVSVNSTVKAILMKRFKIDDCKWMRFGNMLLGGANIGLEVTRSEIGYSDSEGFRGFTGLDTTQNTYANFGGNHIHHCGQIDHIRGGGSVSGDYCWAHHNLVEECAGQSFSNRSRWSNFEYNEINNCTMEMDDAGSLYLGNTQGQLVAYSTNVNFNKFSGKTGYSTDANGNLVTNGARDLYYDDNCGGLDEDDRSIVYGNIFQNRQAVMVNTGNYIDFINNLALDNDKRIYSCGSTQSIDLRWTRNICKSSFDPICVYGTGSADYYADYNALELTPAALNSTFAFGLDGALAPHLAQGHDANTTFGPITINPDTFAVTSGAPPGWVDIPVSQIGLAGYVHGKPGLFLLGNGRYAREPEIVAGGKILKLVVVGDRWAATLGDDNALTTGFLNGITGGGGTGWAAVRTALTHAHVVRTDDNTITITLPAVPTYAITADETLAVTIPANCFQTYASTVSIVAPFTGTIKEGAWHPTMMKRAMFWNPNDLASITKDGGNLVAQINNLGTQTLPFLQATAASKPTYNATGINGKPALEFPQVTGTQFMQLGTNTGRNLNFFAVVFHNDLPVNATSVAEGLLSFGLGQSDVTFHRGYTGAAAVDARVTFITPGGSTAWSSAAGTIAAGDHVLVGIFNKTAQFVVGWHIYIDDMNTDLRNVFGGSAWMTIGTARIGQSAPLSTHKFKGKIGPIVFAAAPPGDRHRIRAWVAAAANYGF